MGLIKRSTRRSIAFRAFGVDAVLEVSHVDLEPSVREILPPGWTEARSREGNDRFTLERAGEDYDVLINGVRMLESASLDVALHLLDAEIRMLIATRTTEWVFVHAGVVALDQRALVVPGASFTGKTTLVRALVESGATYFSDEYAVLDGDGMVHPYPRYLSIRGADGSAAAKRHVREFGGTSGEAPAQVAVVAVTRYQRGSEWQPQRLSTGEGVLTLLANTVPAQKRPKDSLRAVSRAVRRARVVSGDRGEAAAAAQALLAELRRAPSG